MHEPDSWHVRKAPDTVDASARQAVWHCHNNKHLSDVSAVPLTTHLVVAQRLMPQALLPACGMPVALCRLTVPHVTLDVEPGNPLPIPR